MHGRMDPQLKAILQKQRYYIVGITVGQDLPLDKILLREGKAKQVILRRSSHNCMQMSPGHPCNLACTYCWREPHMDTVELSDKTPRTSLRIVRSARRCCLVSGAIKVPREKVVDAKTAWRFSQWRTTLYTRLGEYMDLCHSTA